MGAKLDAFQRFIESVSPLTPIYMSVEESEKAAKRAMEDYRRQMKILEAEQEKLMKEYIHESKSFDRVDYATTWLEDRVEPFAHSVDWVLEEARVVWVNSRWNAGYTAVKRQGELFGTEGEEH